MCYYWQRSKIPSGAARIATCFVKQFASKWAAQINPRNGPKTWGRQTMTVDYKNSIWGFQLVWEFAISKKI
jgi:hypothetical protein